MSRLRPLIRSNPSRKSATVEVGVVLTVEEVGVVRTVAEVGVVLTVAEVGVVLTVVGVDAVMHTTAVVMVRGTGIGMATTDITTTAIGMVFPFGSGQLRWLVPTTIPTTTPNLHPGTLVVVAGIGRANVVPTGTHGATLTAA